MNAEFFGPRFAPSLTISRRIIVHLLTASLKSSTTQSNVIALMSSGRICSGNARHATIDSAIVATSIAPGH